MHSEVYNEAFRQLEIHQKNHDYDEEQILYNAVKRGDMEFLNANRKIIIPAFPLILGDQKKNGEYMAVIYISLLARAAVEGGVPFRKCMLYSDAYLRKIDTAGSEEKLRILIEDAIAVYTNMVRAIHMRRANERHVENTCKYIEEHLLDKLSLNFLAAQASVTPAYLTTLFRKTIGMTLTDYIQNKKIYAAMDMLMMTEEKISEIGDYLNFASASYFCRTFKKVVGVSPRQFREMDQLLKQTYKSKLKM